MDHWDTETDLLASVEKKELDVKCEGGRTAQCLVSPDSQETVFELYISKYYVIWYYIYYTYSPERSDKWTG